MVYDTLREKTQRAPHFANGHSKKKNSAPRVYMIVQKKMAKKARAVGTERERGRERERERNKKKKLRRVALVRILSSDRRGRRE